MHLLQDKNWRSVYKDGTPKVIEMSKYFEKMLMAQANHIYIKIKECDVMIFVCSSNDLIMAFS